MKAFPSRSFIAVHNPVLRAIHWLMAALIFIALALGVWSTQLPRAEFRSEVLFVHKSIGITVLALVLVRIAVRLMVGAPAYVEPLGRLLHAAANTGHLALYALMIAMPVTGYILSSAGGHDIPWFGLFEVPSVVHRDKGLAEAGTQAHHVLAWTIGVVLAVHLAAVFWHAALKRDAVLTRMWPRFQPKAAPRAR